MRFHETVLWLLLALALVPPASAQEAPEPIGSALELRLLYDGPREIDPWAPLEATLSIENTSPDTSYPAVLPGDGSWVGWREPTMKFEWQSFDAGADAWTSIPSDMPGRCGNFDPEWRDEIVRIPPGGSASLWSPPLRFWARLSGHSRVRVRAVYAYDARSPEREGRPQPSGEPHETGDPDLRLPFGAMGNTPAFKLVSEWIEFTVRPALTLDVRQVMPFPPKGRIDPLEYFEVTLVNSTERPFEVFTPNANPRHVPGRLTTLDFWIGASRIMRAHYTCRPENGAAALVLQPGESIALNALPRSDAVREQMQIKLLPDEIRRDRDGAGGCPFEVTVYRSDWDYVEVLTARDLIEWEGDAR